MKIEIKSVRITLPWWQMLLILMVLILALIVAIILLVELLPAYKIIELLRLVLSG